MTDGRPCGLKDGHKGGHRSASSVERGHERTRNKRANDPEYRERDRERKRNKRANDPEFRERERENTRKWSAANPLSVYLHNQNKASLNRIAKMEALQNGQ